MKRRQIVLAAALFAAISAAPLTTHADEIPVEILTGLEGGLMLQGVTEVGDAPAEHLDGRSTENSGFFPSFGVGPAIGLSVEGRMWNIVGLESGLYFSGDNATGWVDREHNNEELGRIYADQRSNALHIPLLARATANTPIIRPFFGLGVEFVLQTASDLDYRSRAEEGTDPAALEDFRDDYDANNTIEPSNYSLFQITTGVEIDLGELRIPIEVRGGY
ncbi:MAG: hypothetical protein ACOCV2_03645, partial [Persicimonas sp.]